MVSKLLQISRSLNLRLPRHRNDDRGAALVEYALLLVFIVIVCVIAFTVLGTTTSGGLNDAGTSGFPP